MAKKRVEETRGGGESGTSRWMLTYLDMVTLLFGVFIILYAMSNVEKSKVEAVTESLRMGFQSGITIFGGPTKGGQTLFEHLNPPGTYKRYLYDRFREALKYQIKNNMVDIKETERGISISLANDIYFDPGSWRLSGDTLASLYPVAQMLAPLERYIDIEGHTDDAAVVLAGQGKKIHDNWELGALRAISVLHYLIDEGVDPAKLSIHSFGKYRPAVPLDKDFISIGGPEFRSLNRRVDIVIITDKVFTRQVLPSAQKKRERAFSDESGNQPGED